MKKKALILTNPYLKDPVKRAKMLRVNIVTSTAIEGVHIKISKKAASAYKTVAARKQKSAMVRGKV